MEQNSLEDWPNLHLHLYCGVRYKDSCIRVHSPQAVISEGRMEHFGFRCSHYWPHIFATRCSKFKVFKSYAHLEATEKHKCCSKHEEAGSNTDKVLTQNGLCRILAVLFHLSLGHPRTSAVLQRSLEPMQAHWWAYQIGRRKMVMAYRPRITEIMWRDVWMQCWDLLPCSSWKEDTSGTGPPRRLGVCLIWVLPLW